jgi:deazaflavin-dependent oxidoreductase (nitroreductase family)
MFSGNATIYFIMMIILSKHDEFYTFCYSGGILMTKPELPEEVRQWNEAIKRNPQLTEGMGPVHLLSVLGRTSGELRSTPVSLLPYAGHRWLVAGFAEADWVKNMRVSGWGILTKGQHSERVTVAEVAPEERASILQAFVQQMRGGRFAFPIGPDEPLEAFAALAERHPIFRVVKATPAPSIEEAARMNEG